MVSLIADPAAAVVVVVGSFWSVSSLVDSAAGWKPSPKLKRGGGGGEDDGEKMRPLIGSLFALKHSSLRNMMTPDREDERLKDLARRGRRCTKFY